MRWLLSFVLCLCFSLASANQAEPQGTLKLAVASNFGAAATELARRFESETGHTLLISLGATAKHYLQIQHGAPFDIFLAADSKHPQLLAQQRLTIADSRMTYAIGQLALWRPNEPFAADFDERAFSKLPLTKSSKFAIANPLLAPYGTAAKEVLINTQLWPQIHTQLVTGENVSQTYQFVASGAAQIGLVAWSQLQQQAPADIWKVPSHLHTAIEQQAIQLNNQPLTQRFMAFLASPAAKLVIRQHGYLVP